MARRTRNRMELRDQFDAAERRKEEEETDEDEEEEEGDDEDEEEDEEASGEEDEGEAAPEVVVPGVAGSNRPAQLGRSRRPLACAA